MKKEKTFTQKFRENPFILTTFVLGIMCLILIIDLKIIDLSYSQSDEEIVLEEFNETLVCQSIQGTPAWITDNNEVITYGYKEINQTLIPLFLNQLMNERVHFVYSSTCLHCKDQIEDFGKYWEIYQGTKLTHDCRGILG